MSEIKLLPCPFCGSEAELSGARGPVVNWVECSRCTAAVTDSVRDEAIANWNRRDEKPELLNCPFCGHEADLQENLEHDWRVDCVNCPVATYWQQDREQAVEKWNHRTERRVNA